MVSVCHCVRCALQVDTDWDTETLYFSEWGDGPICAECAEILGVYHPENEELFEDDWDETLLDDMISRWRDIGGALK